MITLRSGSCFLFFASCFQILSLASAQPIAGDANSDGAVDAVDVQTVINKALGIDTGGHCDIDYSQDVNAVDVQLLINAALGIPIDSDNDGLGDAAEANLGTNPGLGDTDGDGIGDGQEMLNGTDPLSPPVEYTLSLSIQGNGSITLDPPGGAYASGTVVTLTPNPNADSRFEVWGGDLLGTKKPATITMDGNKYVNAYFMPKLFTNFYPSNLCAVGSTLYFLGMGAYSGQELWKSDGTFEGTVLVKDIAPIQDSPGATFLTNLNGTLYFFAQWGGYALWKSDGTEDGTVKVAQLGSSFPALAPVKVGTKLYWSAIGTAGGELWSSDGTTGGTGIVKSFGSLAGSNPNMLTNVDGVLYFNNVTATNTKPPTTTFTLWKSDGSEAGTIPIYSAGSLSEIASLNGQVFFYSGTAGNPHTDSLYTTNGTPAGTHKMSDFYFGPGDFTRSGSLLYFAAESLDLYNTRVWATDGATVYRVDANAYRPWDLIDLNGTLLFEALYDVTSVAHCGLFATTGSGAALVKEINPTLFYGVESYHVVVNDTLYFAAENSYGGLGLWKSNGTTAGTVLVSDINATGLGPYYLTNVNGTLFFAAQDDAHGFQLWKSNGTFAGTLPISCPTP